MIRYFEDIAIGNEMELGSHTFGREEIIRFAQKYDPQPYHLSDAAAVQTHFGKLCASGWQTAGIFMRLLVQKKQALEAEAKAKGEPVALTGPSPGLEDLKWIRPVFVGDTISYKRIVSGKTESKSRPEWGLIHGENHGINQNGEPVFFFKSNVFQQRRDRG
ncbi:MaoC family dehydratase [Labrenzia sp. CE80]|uniref:MaoC family dehydratase n=1 Tax=Labrenzia sp. CE80 TaxID=1788986 RepID=UPI00129A7422|nr:MaoC family dehydratase [Labrenzia sp. CE80]